MTQKQTGKFVCECGAASDIELFGSVNVTIGPELQKKVASREINTFTCPHCGTKLELIAPFIYHDMEKKWMISVYPESERVNAEAIKQHQMKMYEILIPVHRALVTEPTFAFGYDELFAIIQH